MMEDVMMVGEAEHDGEEDDHSNSNSSSSSVQHEK